jgi:hypothetical protein
MQKKEWARMSMPSPSGVIEKRKFSGSKSPPNGVRLSLNFNQRNSADEFLILPPLAPNKNKNRTNQEINSLAV